MGYDNSVVAEAWMRGVNATSHTGNLRTCGQLIWSYELLIGFTCPTRGNVVFDYTAGGQFKSMTTSKHVGLARRHAETVVKPPQLDIWTHTHPRAIKALTVAC